MEHLRVTFRDAATHDAISGLPDVLMPRLGTDDAGRGYTDPHDTQTLQAVALVYAYRVVADLPVTAIWEAGNDVVMGHCVFCHRMYHLMTLRPTLWGLSCAADDPTREVDAMKANGTWPM